MKTNPKAKPISPSTKPKPAKKGGKNPVTKQVRKRTLNIRQERFCEFIVAGVKPADAWLKAGYEVTRFVAQRNAQESLLNPLIVAHIAKLRAPERAANRLTRDRKLELLRDIAEKEANPLDARLRAMAEDSKMQGHYEPEKQQIDHRVSNLDDIRQRAREARSPFARPV